MLGRRSLRWLISLPRKNRIYLLTSAFLASVLAASAAHAISETGYLAAYRSTVEPFYLSVGNSGVFLGEKGVALRYRAFEAANPTAEVVVLPGYDENFHKYDEVAYDLFSQGYSVYVLDHRGQGNSQRLVPPPMAFIDNYEYFVADVETFLEKIVPKGRPRYLLAHSMGGAIGALFLERHPDAFQKAVLVSPMLAANYGVPESFEGLVGKAIEAYGAIKQSDAVYAPTKGPNAIDSIQFGTNVTTHSRARFAKNTRILRADPQLLVGGESVGWVKNALALSQSARAGAELATTPLLLLEAPDDKVVFSDAETAFCKAAPACELLTFPGARHEILMETDSIRAPAMEKILSHFSKAIVR